MMIAFGIFLGILGALLIVSAVLYGTGNCPEYDQSFDRVILGAAFLLWSANILM